MNDAYPPEEPFEAYGQALGTEVFFGRLFRVFDVCDVATDTGNEIETFVAHGLSSKYKRARGSHCQRGG